MTDTTNGIDRAEMQTFLRVVEAVDALPHHHPDAVAVRRATARIFKTVKKRAGPSARGRRPRRRRGRDRRHRHRRAGPHRRRDAGPAARHGRRRARCAGTLLRARACYICKQRYTRGRRVLPPALPALRRAEPRQARRPHRPHRPARAAHRRPGEDRHVHRAAAAARRRAHHDHDALPRATRCAASRAMPDSAEWMHRLRVVGIDLRDPAQVVALADAVAEHGPARHPDQQRRADRAPLARRLRALVEAESGAAAGRPAAGDDHVRPHQRRPPAALAGSLASTAGR